MNARDKQELMRLAEKLTAAELLALAPRMPEIDDVVEAERLRRLQAKVARLPRRERCGAKSRRTGQPCRRWAMPNGRCPQHGGKSTGPKTPEGKARTLAAMREGWRRWAERRKKAKVTKKYDGNESR
ncbi:MAG: hypothetical protein D6682_03295 [Zetaproteobacteria bacterium]|nr:MAG: hypothetical protein D6682_03295 [Zetaproteobacteria bacterium]